MKKEKINEIVRNLQKINWDFSDFTSSKYPYDLNSIPWYPATFISPIPRLLIASLSNEGDVVLDPFGGKGTTAIESVLQNRVPLYCDLNPFIAECTEGLFAAIEYVLNENNELTNEKMEVSMQIPNEQDADQLMKKYHINQEVFKWFHKNTVYMILAIVKSIYSDIEKGNQRCWMIKKLALSSILKSASSQKEHFTYITDNCKPSELIQRDAIQLYTDKIEQILKAAKEFILQYKLVFQEKDLHEILQKRKIITGNAKDLSWIDKKSVDLVVTSPPYLCSQDYIRTMRLINLFFENRKAFEMDVKEEIGARASRRGKSEVIVPKFYSDMREVFKNIDQVLKDDGIFALVVGQGKSKIISEYNVILDLSDILESEFAFKSVFKVERQIGSRVIQVGGVDKESVLIFTR